MKSLPTSEPVTSQPSPKARRAALVTETLAYLGGAVVLAGVGLIAARYWSDLHDVTRLALAASMTVLLVGCGFAVPTGQPAGHRMQMGIWLLSTASAGLFFGLLGGDLLEWSAIDTTLLTGIGVSCYVAALWLWSGRSAVPLQLAFLAATLVSAGAAGAHLDEVYWPGLAVWFVALQWFLLGLTEVVPARRATQAAAAVGLLVGVGIMVPHDAGILIGLGTVVGLLVHAVRARDLVLVLIGAAGALQILPIAVTEWFPGRLAAPIGLLIVGVTLVGAAIVMARGSAFEPSARGSGHQPAIHAERYDAVIFDLDVVVGQPTVRAVPGVSTLIDRLGSEGLSCAIASGSRRAADTLAAAGLEGRFDVVVDGLVVQELGISGEPDPSALLVAAHRLGVGPSRTVVVENSEAGVEAARSGGFGLVIGLAPTGLTTELIGRGADLTVSDLAELLVVPDPAPVR